MVKHRVAGGQVLGIRIGRGGVCTLSWHAVESELGRLGGSALCLALVAQSAEPRLVFALGEATRRGLPSSGRVHLAGRSPLTGGFTEGAVGGNLAWALVGLLGDAAGLFVEAEAGVEMAGGVLELAAGAAGEVEARVLELGAEAAGLGAAGLARRLVLEVEGDLCLDTEGGVAADVRLEGLRVWGEVAAIACGPGARRGVPYGILVTGDEVAVATGRGGLGTLLARLGLAAVRVRGVCVAAAAGSVHAELARAVRASPRLGERARGGTLELFRAYAARGELRGQNHQDLVSRDEAEVLGLEAAAAEVGHVGCKGCPTPCGLVFERGRGRGGARFSATYALGPNLGFSGAGAFRAALELLEACDEVGLDAREAGACLALLARVDEGGGCSLRASGTSALSVGAGEAGASGLGPSVWPEGAVAPRFGDLESLLAALEVLPAMGSAELARRLGLEREDFSAGGQSARPEANLAAVLGQVVATAGNDPMRSFPFLVARPGGSGPELPDGTPVEPGAFDPHSPVGKGALVAWHEDLAAALDISGFCSFSAAGLLVDGALDLDTLADWIAPAALARGPGIGRRFVEAGRELVEARRALDLELRGPLEVPPWAAEQLALPGMLDEYLAHRNPVPDRLREASRTSAAHTPGPTPARPKDAPKAARQASATRSPQPVRHRIATVGATGTLASILGKAPFDVELDLPAPLIDVIEALAAKVPRARPQLFDSTGRLLPSIWRAGAPVRPKDAVAAGDHLDLLLVIGGG